MYFTTTKSVNELKLEAEATRYVYIIEVDNLGKILTLSRQINTAIS